MTQSDFLEKFEKEKPIYSTWGNFVRDSIHEQLSRLGEMKSLDDFIKIPVEPRIKSNESIIEKAFYRNKDYQNPYREITDKVGIRYVVLLIDDIDTICEVIESCSYWTYSKDRDFEQERIENPIIFDYQSVHYVVNSKKEIEVESQTIPAGIPCEIQIRTLSQHAFSELTHETVYKEKIKAEPHVLRSIAKSMSLIEIVDKLFSEVNMNIKRENEKYEGMLSRLTSLYEEIQKPKIQERINYFLLDACKPEWEDVNPVQIKEFLEEKPFVKERIKKLSHYNLLYKQPIVILLYYLIAKNPRRLYNNLPITTKEIRPLFIDLGISVEQFEV